MTTLECDLTIGNLRYFGKSPCWHIFCYNQTARATGLMALNPHQISVESGGGFHPSPIFSSGNCHRTLHFANGGLPTMQHICSRCGEELIEDGRITRIIDGRLYLFCCYECRFQWVIRHFRRRYWTDQLTIFQTPYYGASAPLFPSQHLVLKFLVGKVWIKGCNPQSAPTPPCCLQLAKRPTWHWAFHQIWQYDKTAKMQIPPFK